MFQLIGLTLLLIHKFLRNLIAVHLQLCLATATHNIKWAKYGLTTQIHTHISFFFNKCGDLQQASV